MIIMALFSFLIVLHCFSFLLIISSFLFFPSLARQCWSYLNLKGNDVHIVIQPIERLKGTTIERQSEYRGSEWGHLDKTKRLIFWLCNIKQLNFRHFKTDRKKFTVTINFSLKETKMASKRPIFFCLVYQEIFSHFPTIPNHLGRFPKTTEDFRGEIRKFLTTFCRTHVQDTFFTV